jgi:anti-anti-sigma regulatory factor
MDLRVSREGQHLTVTISGVVDEHADFSGLAPLTGRVRLDLRGVRRFNSFGCRLWVDALRALSGKANLTFVACSPAVIDQLNGTYGFLGHGTVESFLGTMRCDSCDHEFDHLFDARECAALDGLPPVTCPSCHGHSQLDDNVEQYLLFLREPTQVGG